MNPKQILKISLSELKRSNTKLNRKVIYILLPTIILVLLLMFIFLSSEDMFQSKFYTIEFTRDSKMITLDNKYILRENADITIDYNNNVIIYNKNYFRSKAATELFIKNIKLYNLIITKELPEKLRTPVLIRTELIESNKTIEGMTFQPEQFRERIPTQDPSLEMDNNLEYIEDEDLLIRDNNFINEIEILNDELKQSTNNLIEENNEIYFEIEHEIQDLQEPSFFDLEELKKNIEENELKTPSELSPSLPFEPIYLALIVIIVLTFLSLIFSNRIYDEKVNSKGLLLLASPVSKWDIIIGKTLPFTIISILIVAVIGIIKTNSFEQTLLLCLLAIPVTLVYFSISLFTALISRSFKELSFLGIFNISLYSLFLLVPAFMISFSEASLASPLTIIVKIIMNETISLDLLLFSILPSVFLAIIIFLVSGSLLTTENLFSYRNINSKIFNVYKENVYNLKRLFLISAASIPFIFFIQLALIVIIVSFNAGNKLFILLLVSAFIEESFKSLGIYALFKSNKLKKNIKNSVIAGFVTGLGFFIAEKFMLLLMITPFITQYNLIVFSGLVIPLILHSLISIIFALGLRKNLKSFWFMLIIVTILHFFANVFLIMNFG